MLRAPREQLAQVIDGDLYLHPRPAMPHAVAAAVLGMDLGSPFQRGRGGPGGWWIIDGPGAQTLEVFRLDGETYRFVATHEGDERARIEPFEAVELELAALWGKNDSD